ncbi:hypothetical protein [Streptomyces sp. NPDC048277]|uniref:hypothetical protein n=1 Tax=Streptomyces sp. NPDC048277 TaxID=3155027 RepID=UPI00340989C1
MGGRRGGRPGGLRCVVLRDRLGRGIAVRTLDGAVGRHPRAQLYDSGPLVGHAGRAGYGIRVGPRFGLRPGLHLGGELRGRTYAGHRLAR